MAVLSQYGAICAILNLEIFKDIQAEYFGSISYGRIRLFVDGALHLDTYKVDEILDVLAKRLDSAEITICEYNGHRASLLAETNEDDKGFLKINWSVKDANGEFKPVEDLSQMNIGVRLHFADPQYVHLMQLIESNSLEMCE